jgi:hypothetical protein
MQVKRMPTAFRYEIARKAKKALAVKGFESRPTWCQRWVKQVLLSLGVSSELAVEGSQSARVAFNRYQDMGMVMPKGTVANIGDILYKVRATDGRAGHVGIYIGDNLVAENSSAHVGIDDNEARGVRSLDNFPEYRVVRIWETPKNPR